MQKDKEVTREEFFDFLARYERDGNVRIMKIERPFGNYYSEAGKKLCFYFDKACEGKGDEKGRFYYICGDFVGWKSKEERVREIRFLSTIKDSNMVHVHDMLDAIENAEQEAENEDGYISAVWNAINQLKEKVQNG